MAMAEEGKERCDWGLKGFQHFINLLELDDAHVKKYPADESVFPLFYFLCDLNLHCLVKLVHRDKSHLYGSQTETSVYALSLHLVLLIYPRGWSHAIYDHNRYFCPPKADEYL